MVSVALYGPSLSIWENSDFYRQAVLLQRRKIGNGLTSRETICILSHGPREVSKKRRKSYVIYQNKGTNRWHSLGVET